MLWEILIGVIVVAAFIAAIALWVHSALRRVKRSQVRRTAYISSALNSLSHGVVMTDPHNSGSSIATTVISRSTACSAPICRPA